MLVNDRGEEFVDMSLQCNAREQYHVKLIRRSFD